VAASRALGLIVFAFAQPAVGCGWPMHGWRLHRAARTELPLRVAAAR